MKPVPPLWRLIIDALIPYAFVIGCLTLIVLLTAYLDWRHP